MRLTLGAPTATDDDGGAAAAASSSSSTAQASAARSAGPQPPPHPQARPRRLSPGAACVFISSKSFAPKCTEVSSGGAALVYEFDYMGASSAPSLCQTALIPDPDRDVPPWTRIVRRKCPTMVMVHFCEIEYDNDASWAMDSYVRQDCRGH